jgi:hypothetical protein
MARHIARRSKMIQVNIFRCRVYQREDCRRGQKRARGREDEVGRGRGGRGKAEEASQNVAGKSEREERQF